MKSSLEKYRKTITNLLKLVFIFGAILFIVQKIKENENSLYFLEQLFQNLDIKVFLPFLLLQVTMSGGNWFFEFKKWKFLVKDIKEISFFESVKQSLASLTISIITPNRIGEYGAKALFYKKENQKQILFLNFLGNFSQLIITIIFGCIGLFFIWKTFPDFFQVFDFSILGILIFVFLLIIAILIWKKDKIPTFLNTKKFYRTSSFALLRYLFFSHQFYFFLQFFAVEITYFEAMISISSMYLISSIIPSIAIFDWVLKGSIAVLIFTFFKVESLAIITVSFLMWFLNFAIPTIIGCIFVFSIPTKFQFKTKIKA
ncbi:lysylphosphatidylglycerol synthase transmembrane domain-containing protein [Aureivirga marina]|uniref:lysylphosphatidylglycerol synthase domain-containing protein n=1 Tax=Aureivirga marina TaxID=1182451 RepID=UPI0018C97D0C|nr:lysylphosphatidylglycerol synthase domain-containing protein [Aureivirga marina]